VSIEETEPTGFQRNQHSRECRRQPTRLRRGCLATGPAAPWRSGYHVFLTGHDSDAVLSVFDRTPDGFRVRATDAAEGTFSWRVVAQGHCRCAIRARRDSQRAGAARRAVVALRRSADAGRASPADRTSIATAEAKGPARLLKRVEEELPRLSDSGANGPPCARRGTRLSFTWLCPSSTCLLRSASSLRRQPIPPA
jgi:hypothetical protein